MKKIFVSLFLIFSFINIVSGQKIAFNYKGEWSQWEFLRGLTISRYNDCSGLILKTNGGLKAFSFRINNFRFPDKKERKEHEKSGQPFYFHGTVEYYVNNVLPTASDIAKKCWLIAPSPRNEQVPPTLKRSSCEIRILPFKKEPEIWNIFFDNIGIAVSTKGLKFK